MRPAGRGRAGVAVRGAALAVLAGLAVFAAPLAAASERTYGDLTVTTLPTLPGERTHGYLEYRFRLANDGPAAHQVVLAALLEGYGSGRLRLRRAVEVPAGSRLEVAMRQPPFALWVHQVEVSVDGRDVEPLGAPSSMGAGASFGDSPGEPLVLASSRLAREALPPEPPAEGSSEASEGLAAGRPPPGVRVVRADVPPAGWSPSWLAYSGFEGVALSAAELAEAPEAVRVALRAYAEAGGVLLVVGPGPAASLLDLAGAGSATGSGRLVRRQEGFGVVVLAADPTALDAVAMGVLLADLQRAGAPWRQPRGGAAAAARKAVPVHDATVPVRGLFLFILAFVTLVGPVNLLLLDRWKRRLWILVTVPAIAGLATAGLVAYGYLAEGFLRQHSVLSVTLLDQATHRAATWAWSGFYASLTPSEGLQLGEETEVTPLFDLRGPGARDLDLGIDWSLGQRLAPGWLVARSPVHLETRAVAARRQRLLLARGPDGRLEVENGLGAPLEALLVADAGGGVWSGVDVPVGGRRLLVRSGVVPDAPGDVAAEVTSAGLPQAAGRLVTEPRQYLVAGTYVARLAGDPFSEPGLARAEGVHLQALVVGRLAPGEP